MTRSLTFMLLGSAALAASSAASAQTTSPPANAPMTSTVSAADCDQLIKEIDQRKDQNLGITAEQARDYRKNNNFQVCHDTLVRIDRMAGNAPAGQSAAPQQADATSNRAEAGRIVVQQPAPTIRVQQASPEVTVGEAQPQVTVRQPQPEIIVHQPAPTVTVDIPQPEITVRMPKPDVNVAMTQPQVQVNQPPPQVQVVQPTQQPTIQVQRAQAQVNIQQPAGQAGVAIQQAEGSPQVRYERDQPKVVVHNAPGQPTVHVEAMSGPAAEASADQASQMKTPAQRAEQASAAANQQNAMATGTTATNDLKTPGVSSAAATNSVMVSQLLDMNLYNARGNELGDIEHVVQDAAGKQFIVIGHGGFLGLGEKRVAIPLDNVWKQGDRIVTRGLTDDQIRAMPQWGSAGYRDLNRNLQVDVALTG